MSVLATAVRPLFTHCPLFSYRSLFTPPPSLSPCSHLQESAFALATSGETVQAMHQYAHARAWLARTALLGKSEETALLGNPGGTAGSDYSFGPLPAASLPPTLESSRAEPSQVEPSRAEPSRVEANRVKSSQAKASFTEASFTEASFIQAPFGQVASARM